MNKTTPMTLGVVFIADDSKNRKGFMGVRCELPNGQTVETRGRRTPLYDLARELDQRGYGDSLLQVFTPTGTPSLRGLVKVMAELTVEESDRGGLRLRKFRPLPPGGLAVERDVGSSGTHPSDGEVPCALESPSHQVASQRPD